MLHDSKWLALLIAVSVWMCAGCGTSGPVPVEGKVTLDGKPLANAAVTFSPTKAQGPGPFVDETDGEGRFVLGSVGSEGSGAVAGEYMVMITTVKQAPGGMEDSPAPTQKEIVPAAFRDGSKRFTVPEGGVKDANFDMKSK